jgi:hypothetical protein
MSDAKIFSAQLRLGLSMAKIRKNSNMIKIK